MADNSENQVEITIVLDDGSVQKGFANIKQSGEETASFLQRAFGIKSFTDFAAATLVAKKAFDIFKDSVRAGIEDAMQSESATIRLASALSNVPGATFASLEAFKSFSEVLSKQVGIDSDVINSNAALLSSIGRLSGDGLQNATKAALDLSAGLGISLDTAFKRIAVAAEGNTSAFQKIGFQIRQSGTDGEKFAQVLAQIDSRFGGLAQSQAVNTFEGISRTMNGAFNDLNKSLGTLITNSPAIREIMKIITDGLRSLTGMIKDFGEAGGFDKLISKVVDFSSTINTYLIRPLEFFFNIFKMGIEGIDVVVKNVIASIGIIGLGIAKLLEAAGVTNSLTEGMKEFGNASAIVAGESIRNFSDLKTVLDTPLTDGLAQGIANVQVGLQNLKPVNDQFIQDMYAGKSAVEQVKGAITDGIIFNEQYSSSFAAIGGAFSQVSDSMKKAALDIGVSAKSIARSIITGIGSAAGNAFASFGRAMVEGTNALDAFVNSLLASMGQMAVQLGTQFILQGAAYIWAGLPNGPPLIAAGAALATFGGVLAALGGKSSAPSSSGGGGASVDTGGGLSMTPSEMENTTKERQTKEALVVNINGDILGDESSGKRLVDLINSAFDVSGVELRQGLA